MSTTTSQVPSSAAELSENQKQIRLTVDLPGVLPADLHVSIHQGVLTVSGVRNTMSFDGLVCIKKHRFQRRYAIDTRTVNVATVKADLAHGVLTINAKKVPHVRNITRKSTPSMGSMVKPSETLSSSSLHSYSALAAAVQTQMDMDSRRNATFPSPALVQDNSISRNVHQESASALQNRNGSTVVPAHDEELEQPEESPPLPHVRERSQASDHSEPESSAHRPVTRSRSSKRKRLQ